MHQGFGAMDAQRDALDTRVLRVENLYLHRTRQGMRESRQPEQSKRVRKRVMQDIGSSCGRATEITTTTDTQPMVQGNDGGSIDRVVFGGLTSVSCSVPADGIVGNVVGYRVYISDRTLQNIWDEFEVGLNGQPSLNDLNRKFGSAWRHRSDHKNHNKLLNVHNLMKRYCYVCSAYIALKYVVAIEVDKRSEDRRRAESLKRLEKHACVVFLFKSAPPENLGSASPFFLVSGSFL